MKKPATFTVVGLGELIWDMLPAGKQLGGAPTNFAYIAGLLGDRAIVASRIGDDELGREAAKRLERMGISTRYLQLDAEHPTGTVGVRVDVRGEPHFSVNENSAWDYLEWTPAWEELAARADAVCYGTLGQRTARAARTITSFLEHTRPEALRVFDVNLRHSFFTAEMLAHALSVATIVKLNAVELSNAARLLNFREREERALGARLLREFGIGMIAVTRGAGGSLLLTAEEAVEHPGLRVRVADTIGAGDAFTATLAHYYLRRAPLEIIGEAANRVGAWVATQAGATPEAPPQWLEQTLGGF
ncbi:MAG: carbohydrate kinase [Acidobacteria bacterium]|nr:carbohydrate kinase [Acidobacteriota bacterium]